MCRAVNLLPYNTDYLEIWGHQPPGTLRASPGLYMDCFTFTITIVIFLSKIQNASLRTVTSVHCQTEKFERNVMSRISQTDLKSRE